jgi:hypothetical protein
MFIILFLNIYTNIIIDMPFLLHDLAIIYQILLNL